MKWSIKVWRALEGLFLISRHFLLQIACKIENANMDKKTSCSSEA